MSIGMSCMWQLSIRYSPYILSDVVFTIPYILSLGYYSGETISEKFPNSPISMWFFFSYSSFSSGHISLDSPLPLVLSSPVDTRMWSCLDIIFQYNNSNCFPRSGAKTQNRDKIYIVNLLFLQCFSRLTLLQCHHWWRQHTSIRNWISDLKLLLMFWFFIYYPRSEFVSLRHYFVH
jgi:hypothetical protein